MSEQDENEEELRNRQEELGDNADVQQTQLAERLSLINTKRTSAMRKKGFFSAFADDFGKIEENDKANEENDEIEMIGRYLPLFVVQTRET